MAQLHLTDINDKNYQEVVALLFSRGLGMMSEYLEAYSRDASKCKVVTTDSGELYALIYGEVQRGSVVNIHAVLPVKSFYRYRDQIRMYREYIGEVFKDERIMKVVTSPSAKSRLSVKLATLVGFSLEGCHRREADGVYDLLYYGLLREEYRNGR